MKIFGQGTLPERERHFHHGGRRQQRESQSPLEILLAGICGESGMTVHVSHFPPGTSKWNKIEHKFSHISMNWKGQALVSLDVIRAPLFIHFSIKAIFINTMFCSIIALARKNDPRHKVCRLRRNANVPPNRQFCSFRRDRRITGQDHFLFPAQYVLRKVYF